MKVTEVKVRKVEDKGKLKAFADVTIDDAIAVHDIRIISGNNGLFVAMPDKKRKDRWMSTVHPINNEARKIIWDAILEEFDRV